MIKVQEFLPEWEKINNPFYPSEMRWDRLTVNQFSKAYDELVEKKLASVETKEVKTNEKSIKICIGCNHSIVTKDTSGICLECINGDEKQID